jgi:hypothetical protein
MEKPDKETINSCSDIEVAKQKQSYQWSKF